MNLIGIVDQTSSVAMISSATTERSAKMTKIVNLERKFVCLENAEMQLRRLLRRMDVLQNLIANLVKNARTSNV